MSGVPARHAGHVAGEAGAVSEAERSEAFAQRPPHASGGLVDEERADEHAAARHGAAARALEASGIKALRGEAGKGFHRLVAARARGLAPEPEEGEQLQARAPEPRLAQHPDVALAELERIVARALGRGHDREQAVVLEREQAFQSASEGASAPERVVLLGPRTVEAHADLEREAGATAEPPQLLDAALREQRAVREHGAGAVRERVGEDVEHLGMHEG